MQITGLPNWAAPQATGHPFGLPAAHRPPVPEKRVQPLKPFSRTDTAIPENLPPSEFWRGARGKPDPASHVAPPSILQIEISRLLDQQATSGPGDDAQAPQDAPRANPD